VVTSIGEKNSREPGATWTSRSKPVGSEGGGGRGGGDRHRGGGALLLGALSLGLLLHRRGDRQLAERDVLFVQEEDVARVHVLGLMRLLEAVGYLERQLVDLDRRLLDGAIQLGVSLRVEREHPAGRVGLAQHRAAEQQPAVRLDRDVGGLGLHLVEGDDPGDVEATPLHLVIALLCVDAVDRDQVLRRADLEGDVLDRPFRPGDGQRACERQGAVQGERFGCELPVLPL
jgi:hypothetical protein